MDIEVAASEADRVSDQRSAVLKNVEVTPAPTLTRSILSWSTGKTTEVWWLKTRNWLIFDHPAGGLVITTNPEMHAGWRPGAELSTWVNDRNFVKETTYEGQTCAYYRRTLSLRPDTVTREPAVTDEAWIEAATGRPLALRQGRTTYRFKFRESLSSSLALPQRFAEEMARAETGSIPPESRKTPLVGKGLTA